MAAMSTERKPGSRGVRNTFSRELANQPPLRGSAPGEPGEPGMGKDPKARIKGKTKTVSPKRSFKRKPRK